MTVADGWPRPGDRVRYSQALRVGDETPFRDGTVKRRYVPSDEHIDVPYVHVEFDDGEAHDVPAGSPYLGRIVSDADRPEIDATRAAAARDEAIERVGRGMDEEWYRHAVRAYKHLAERHEKFVPDAVWELLAEWGIPEPRETRALVHASKRAVEAGYIRYTGVYVKGERVTHHRGQVQVYESLIYQPETLV